MELRAECRWSEGCGAFLTPCVSARHREGGTYAECDHSVNGPELSPSWNHLFLKGSWGEACAILGTSLCSLVASQRHTEGYVRSEHALLMNLYDSSILDRWSGLLYTFHKPPNRPQRHWNAVANEKYQWQWAGHLQSREWQAILTNGSSRVTRAQCTIHSGAAACWTNSPHSSGTGYPELLLN